MAVHKHRSQASLAGCDPQVMPRPSARSVPILALALGRPPALVLDPQSQGLLDCFGRAILGPALDPYRSVFVFPEGCLRHLSARLLRAIDTAELAEEFQLLRSHRISSGVTSEALSLFRNLFGSRSDRGPELLVGAVGPLEDPASDKGTEESMEWESGCPPGLSAM